MKGVRSLAKFEARAKKQALAQVGDKLQALHDAGSQVVTIEHWHDTIEGTQELLLNYRHKANAFIEKLRTDAERLETNRMTKEDARSFHAQVYYLQNFNLKGESSEAKQKRGPSKKSKRSPSGTLLEHKDKLKIPKKEIRTHRKTKQTNKNPQRASVLAGNLKALSQENTIIKCKSQADLVPLHDHASSKRIAQPTKELKIESSATQNSQNSTRLSAAEFDQKTSSKRPENILCQQEEVKERAASLAVDIEQSARRKHSVGKIIINQENVNQERLAMGHEEETGLAIRHVVTRERTAQENLAREDLWSCRVEKAIRSETLRALQEAALFAKEDESSGSAYRDAWYKQDEACKEARERLMMLQADIEQKVALSAATLFELEQTLQGKHQKIYLHVTEKLDQGMRQSYHVRVEEFSGLMLPQTNTSKLRVLLSLGNVQHEGNEATFYHANDKNFFVLDISVYSADHGLLGRTLYDMSRLRRKLTSSECVWLPLRPDLELRSGITLGLVVNGAKLMHAEASLVPEAKAFLKKLRDQQQRHEEDKSKEMIHYELRFRGLQKNSNTPIIRFAGMELCLHSAIEDGVHWCKFQGPKDLKYYHDLRIGEKLIASGSKMWDLESIVLPSGIKAAFSSLERDAPVDPVEQQFVRKVRAETLIRAAILLQKQIRRFRARNERRFREALRYGVDVDGWRLHADVQLKQCYFAHESLPGQVAWTPGDSKQYKKHVKRVTRERKIRLEAALQSALHLLPKEKQYEQIVKFIDQDSDQNLSDASPEKSKSQRVAECLRMLALLEEAPVNDFAAQLSLAHAHWKLYEDKGVPGKLHLDRAFISIKHVLALERPWSEWMPGQVSLMSKVLLAKGCRRVARSELRKYVKFATNVGCDHPDFLLRKGRNLSSRGRDKKGNPKHETDISNPIAKRRRDSLHVWPILENLAALEISADHAHRARHLLYQLLDQEVLQHEPHCDREADYLWEVAMCFPDPYTEMARESRDAAFRAAVKLNPKVKETWLTSSIWWEDAATWFIAAKRLAQRGVLGFAISAFEGAMARSGKADFEVLDHVLHTAHYLGRFKLAQLLADSALTQSRQEAQYSTRAIYLHMKYSENGYRWSQAGIFACALSHGKHLRRQRFLQQLQAAANASIRERNAAAKMLQKIVRARRDRRIVANLRHQHHKASEMRARITARIRHRALSIAYATWHRMSYRQRKSREMCARRLRGMIFTCFNNWQIFHEKCRARKISAAMCIQRQRRVHLLRKEIERRVQQSRAEQARHRFLLQYLKEKIAARTIQRFTRRFLALLRKQRRPEVILQARLRGRYWLQKYRLKKRRAICLQAWWRGCIVRKQVGDMFREHFLQVAMEFAAGEQHPNQGRNQLQFYNASKGKGPSVNKIIPSRMGKQHGTLPLKSLLKGTTKMVRNKKSRKCKGSSNKYLYVDPVTNDASSRSEREEQRVRLPPLGGIRGATNVKAAYVLRSRPQPMMTIHF